MSFDRRIISVQTSFIVFPSGCTCALDQVVIVFGDVEMTSIPRIVRWSGLDLMLGVSVGVD